jgi:hypothetical protein
MIPVDLGDSIVRLPEKEKEKYEEKVKEKNEGEEREKYPTGGDITRIHASGGEVSKPSLTGTATLEINLPSSERTQSLPFTSPPPRSDSDNTLMLISPGVHLEVIRCLSQGQGLIASLKYNY